MNWAYVLLGCFIIAMVVSGLAGLYFLWETEVWLRIAHKYRTEDNPQFTRVERWFVGKL